MTAKTAKRKSRFSLEKLAADQIQEAFLVESRGLKLKFTPDLDAGGYCVSGVRKRGLNTQGDTFEEALANAYDAAKGLKKMAADIRKETHANPAANSRSPARPPQAAHSRRSTPVLA